MEIDTDALKESFDAVMRGIEETEEIRKKTLENKIEFKKRLKGLIVIKVISDNSFYYGKDLSCLPIGTSIHLKLLNKDENNFIIKAYHDDNQIGYADFFGSVEPSLHLKGGGFFIYKEVYYYC